MQQIEDVDNLFPEAHQHWRIHDLYRDLGVIKSQSTRLGLTSIEKACLRGLLCGVHPTDIAERLNWHPKSLMTQLSRDLYHYVKVCTDHAETRISSWRDVAVWLEEKAYKLEQASTEDNLLNKISQPHDYMSAREVIRLVEEEIWIRMTSGLECPILSASFDDIQALGDQQFQVGNYQGALDTYVTLISRCPVERPEMLLKIAQLYDCINAFRDSVAMTYFALQYVQASEARSKLYHLLASAFAALCRATPNPGLLKQALNAYGEAKTYAQGLNAVILWNHFDLLLDFMNANHVYYEQHLISARIAWVEFRDAAANSESNFMAYRQELLTDLERVQARGLTDEWLATEFSTFLASHH